MKYTSIFTLILRLIVSPLFLAIMLVTYVFHAFKRCIMFIRYGGEIINYQKDTTKTIEDVFNELNQNRTKAKNEKSN